MLQIKPKFLEYYLRYTVDEYSAFYINSLDTKSPLWSKGTVIQNAINMIVLCLMKTQWNRNGRKFSIRWESWNHKSSQYSHTGISLSQSYDYRGLRKPVLGWLGRPFVGILTVTNSLKLELVCFGSLRHMLSSWSLEITLNKEFLLVLLAPSKS